MLNLKFILFIKYLLSKLIKLKHPMDIIEINRVGIKKDLDKIRRVITVNDDVLYLCDDIVEIIGKKKAGDYIFMKKIRVKYDDGKSSKKYYINIKGVEKYINERELTRNYELVCEYFGIKPIDKNFLMEKARLQKIIYKDGDKLKANGHSLLYWLYEKQRRLSALNDEIYIDDFIKLFEKDSDDNIINKINILRKLL